MLVMAMLSSGLQLTTNFVGHHGKRAGAFFSMSDDGAPIQFIFYTYPCYKHEWREYPGLSGALKWSPSEVLQGNKVVC